MIITVPNQKIVVVHKEACSKEHPYILRSVEAECRACLQLNSVGALKLWLYLSSNRNNHTTALSPTNALNTYGLKKDSYYKAVEKLKEYGYLVPRENSNVYDFYEIPPKREEE